MKAIVRTIAAAGFLAAFAAPAAAQMAIPKNLNLSKESRLWVEGTSTVKSFSCAATKIDVSVSAEPGSAPSDLVQSASLVVPVSALDCKNDTMNGHMRKAIKADKHSTIGWTMSSYRVEGTSVVMNGRLTIAGKENPVELRATGTADNTGVIRLKGSTKLKMTDFGVKPPSLMMGTMKVGDAITVGYDLVLNP